jgi:hypothetical protein
MVAYLEGSVYFSLVGRSEQCRVSGIALLDKENINEQRLCDADYVAMFEKHRPEIEGIALRKALKGDVVYGGIFVTTADLNVPTPHVSTQDILKHDVSKHNVSTHNAVKADALLTT